MSPAPPNLTSAQLWMERLKTIVAIGGMFILAGFAVDAYFHQNRKKADLAAYPRYTVGEVIKTGVVISPSSHGYSLFTYQVGDSVYTQQGPDEVPKGHIRFLVKFSTQHPTYYKFYERVPIPYYVPPPPPEGWAKLPPELDIPAGAMD